MRHPRPGWCPIDIDTNRTEGDESSLAGGRCDLAPTRRLRGARPCSRVRDHRLACAASIVALLGACSAPPAAVPEWRSIELSLGPHDLDEQSWAPLDARVLGGLTVSGRRPEWPSGVEFSVQYARAESRDDSLASGADFFDFRIGAAWEWRATEWLVLACGAGPRFGLAKVTAPGNFAEVSESDASLGVYAHVAAFVHVGGHFSIGLDGQWADGSDYELLDSPRDAAAAELLVALRWDF